MKGPKELNYRYYRDDNTLYVQNLNGCTRKARVQWKEEDFIKNGYYISGDYWGTTYIKTKAVKSFIFEPDFHNDHKDQSLWLFEKEDGAEYALKTLEENRKYNDTIKIRPDHPDDIFKFKSVVGYVNNMGVLWGREIPDFIKALKKINSPIAESLELYYELHKDDRCKAKKGYEF